MGGWSRALSPLPVEWILKIGSRRGDHPCITIDPAILVGKPVVKGTRLSVEFIIGLLADGWSETDILRNYPGLKHEDVSACLAYARDLLASERSTVTRSSASMARRR